LVCRLPLNRSGRFSAPRPPSILRRAPIPESADRFPCPGFSTPTELPRGLCGDRFGCSFQVDSGESTFPEQSLSTSRFLRSGMGHRSFSRGFSSAACLVCRLPLSACGCSVPPDRIGQAGPASSGLWSYTRSNHTGSLRALFVIRLEFVVPNRTPPSRSLLQSNCFRLTLANGTVTLYHAIAFHLTVPRHSAGYPHCFLSLTPCGRTTCSSLQVTSGDPGPPSAPWPPSSCARLPRTVNSEKSAFGKFLRHSSSSSFRRSFSRFQSLRSVPVHLSLATCWALP